MVIEQDDAEPQCDALARLKLALKKNRRDAHHRYFQLATVAADGSPRNRTLVFRGFAPGDERLLAITDTRSEKLAELSVANTAEIAWYFTQTREQFRLRVLVDCVTESSQEPVGLQLRNEVWRGLSDAAREQFFWLPPGQPLGTGTPPEAADAAPDTFALLFLTPIRIDHLVLAKVQTRRLAQSTEGYWNEQSINP